MKKQLITRVTVRATGILSATKQINDDKTEVGVIVFGTTSYESVDIHIVH